MKKPARERIPKATREQVLKEFRHKCALGGEDSPQLHHIDENPANNDPLNLVPLCPNCHVRDQHDPTAQIAPDLLRLFREHRDPMILHPGFKPLWARCRLLDDVDQYMEAELGDATRDLLLFVEALSMGGYYSKRIPGRD